MIQRIARTLSAALAGSLGVMTGTAATGQEAQPPTIITISQGHISATFRGNDESPRVLSGIDSLFHMQHAPHDDAFDPDAEGASAGANFEHVISGHHSPHNKFTPRHGRYALRPLTEGRSVILVRRAEDSPWRIDSTLQYTVTVPHYVDFEFRCTPRDASLFGEHGYAIFFFANYMNEVEDVALHFRGQPRADAAETWIAADAPAGHPDWNQGGNYRSVPAAPLKYDDDVEFRLNTWSYDWPRFSQPFFYGRAGRGMTFMVMLDRMHSERDEVRFSLYKFKLPQRKRPAWDFQYVIHDVKTDQHYGFRGRLVWKKFVSAEDCRAEYRTWEQNHVRARATAQMRVAEQLRRKGAAVFQQHGEVVEIDANGTSIGDQELIDVAPCTAITDLSLERTHVTAAGLAHLAPLQQLEWLNLYRCPVGDEGLAQLKQLFNLRHLPLGDTGVTDAGLRVISAMPQLQYLGLRDNAITDAGIMHLRHLEQLTGLYLGGTQVTDAGLVHLGTMKRLARLWLNETRVSDEGVPALAKLGSLRELHLAGTHITAAGMAQLQKSLPQCQLITEPD